MQVVCAEIQDTIGWKTFSQPSQATGGPGAWSVAFLTPTSPMADQLSALCPDQGWTGRFEPQVRVLAVVVGAAVMVAVVGTPSSAEGLVKRPSPNQDRAE